MSSMAALSSGAIGRPTNAEKPEWGRGRPLRRDHDGLRGALDPGARLRAHQHRLRLHAHPRHLPAGARPRQPAPRGGGASPAPARHAGRGPPARRPERAPVDASQPAGGRPRRVGDGALRLRRGGLPRRHWARDGPRHPRSRHLHGPRLPARAAPPRRRPGPDGPPCWGGLPREHRRFGPRVSRRRLRADPRARAQGDAAAPGHDAGRDGSRSRHTCRPSPPPPAPAARGLRRPAAGRRGRGLTGASRAQPLRSTAPRDAGGPRAVRGPPRRRRGLGVGDPRARGGQEPAHRRLRRGQRRRERRLHADDDPPPDAPPPPTAAPAGDLLRDGQHGRGGSAPPGYHGRRRGREPHGLRVRPALRRLEPRGRGRPAGPPDRGRRQELPADVPRALTT
jgi:hypothetical protein